MNTTHSKIPGQAVLHELVNEFGYDSITHLKPQQEKFCREFVLNGSNARNAYLQAYPTSQERSAGANGSRLLKTQTIQQRILEIRQELHRRYAVDAQSIIRVLTMSMNADRRQFVDRQGKPLELHELDSEAAAITDVEIILDRHGKKHAIPVVPERIKAAVELAKILGITREKIEISNDFSNLTDEQLEEYAQQATIKAVEEMAKRSPEKLKELLHKVS